jgi:hypothetical protein
MAALFNYQDEKPNVKFKNIYLPEIKIKYDHFTQLFFINSSKSFSPQILNKIWKGINGLSLANLFFNIFEETNDINRSQLSAKTTIQLHKECSFSKITEKAFKIVALNLEELNNALGSIDSRPDGSLCVNTIFHLFSTALNVELKITLRFAIKDVPIHVRGVVGEMDSIVFDFCE